MLWRLFTRIWLPGTGHDSGLFTYVDIKMRGGKWWAYKVVDFESGGD